MSTFTKVALSGASNGKAIKVVATVTTGTTIHTSQSGTTGFDEIWLWAYNSDTVDRALTIEYGATTAPDNNVIVTIPFKAGLILVVPGLILQNSLLVTAFAAAANVVTISGFVNRIT